jgi:hypothetical protein
VKRDPAGDTGPVLDGLRTFHLLDGDPADSDSYSDNDRLLREISNSAERFAEVVDERTIAASDSRGKKTHGNPDAIAAVFIAGHDVCGDQRRKKPRHRRFVKPQDMGDLR